MSHYYCKRCGQEYYDCKCLPLANEPVEFERPKIESRFLGLTDWYEPGVLPVRNGLYICKHAESKTGVWFVFRWCCHSQRWYSANSWGSSIHDAIAGDRDNHRFYHWRGFNQDGDAKRLNYAQGSR